MTVRFVLPEPIWAGDLVREPEPDRYWIVPGMAERGDRCIVTGGEGEGKSTLLRQWAFMVASGIHPLTLEPILPVRTMLLDLENSKEQIKLELKKIAEYSELPVPEEPWLLVANMPNGLNLPADEYETALSELLAQYQPDIIFGGPLYKMADLSLADENASKGLASALDRLRGAHHFALFLEAHQVNESMAFDSKKQQFVRSRPPRPFGSSLWRRWPEFGLCLFTDGTLVHWRQDRRAREWPKKLQREGETWLWEPDTGNCPQCGNPRPEGKVLYCSDKCRNSAKVRRHRQRESKPASSLLDQLDADLKVALQSSDV